MTAADFTDDLSELSTAEDFLEYFGVPFDPAVVQVNRLHILQRFHDYLAQAAEMPAEVKFRWQLHAELLTAAYQDFVTSNAQTEKVFRVFRMNEPRTVTVALTELTQQAVYAPAI
ncbi:nitrogen fixation protein NifW [Chromatium okenii]|uniref:nitrogenase-stabilizing/protective protein NifW n=1 Tax=Chromatium okenii TaxID=61644 RepID=UPI001906D44B|nr:nitrogenase-stabilizing/protective protein NifW [Chromatium okenii]MBK1642058.1 nitrogen fixation protein NifW [Chromatium okenii]